MSKKVKVLYRKVAKYISFCGFFEEPSLSQNNWEETLNLFYPEQFREEYLGTDSHGDECYREIGCGFREGLSYEVIGGQDSLTVYLAKTSENPFVGHLVADCPQGNWVDSMWVKLDEEGNPVKAEENFNPNPVPQVI